MVIMHYVFYVWKRCDDDDEENTKFVVENRNVRSMPESSADDEEEDMLFLYIISLVKHGPASKSLWPLITFHIIMVRDRKIKKINEKKIDAVSISMLRSMRVCSAHMHEQ
jgi:hypothetical protein